MVHAPDSVDSVTIEEGRPEQFDSYRLAVRSEPHGDVTVRVGFAYQKTVLRLRYDLFERELLRACTCHNDRQVYMDSCVEIFLKKPDDPSYCNFEFSAAGYALVARHPDDRTKSFFPPALIDTISRSFVLRLLTEERAVYTVRCDIDLARFGLAAGDSLKGTTLYGNVYKCGFGHAVPHRLSLFPLGEKSDFHQKERFRPMRFV